MLTCCLFHRRGTKPGNSLNAYSTHDVVQPINRPMFSGLKRAALRDSKETSVEENVEKKSKFMEHRILPGYGEGQRREDSTQAAQKRKNVFTKSSHVRTVHTQPSDCSLWCGQLDLFLSNSIKVAGVGGGLYSTQNSCILEKSPALSS